MKDLLLFSAKLDRFVVLKHDTFPEQYSIEIRKLSDPLNVVKEI